MRYMAKHNRSSKNPWSLRQVGVYHQITPQDGKSTWILLQPSEDAYEDVVSHCENSELRSTKEEDVEASCLLYLDLLDSLSLSWGDYIEYLWSEVENLVRSPGCLS